MCVRVQLGVPVVRMWFHQGGKLESVSLSSHSKLSGHLGPSLMMVHYGNQYYLQPLQWEGAGQGTWLQLERKAVGESRHSVDSPSQDQETVASVRNAMLDCSHNDLTVRNMCRCSPDSSPSIQTC